MIEQIVKILVPVISAILAAVCAVYFVQKILSAQREYEKNLEESRKGLDEIVRDGSAFVK